MQTVFILDSWTFSVPGLWSPPLSGEFWVALEIEGESRRAAVVEIYDQLRPQLETEEDAGLLTRTVRLRWADVLPPTTGSSGQI